jgi:hypothetical protein
VTVEEFRIDDIVHGSHIRHRLIWIHFGDCLARRCG